MQAAECPYAMAAAALAAASLVAVTPIAPRPPEIASAATRLLAAGDSLLNVPFNLFQDFVNIPGNEVEAINQLGNADLFGGNWWTPSATNIFGEDPGDPGRFMSVVDLLVPFKALSGLGLGELQGFGDTPDPLAVDPTAIADGNLGLSQQIALLLDAELPVSASSDADWSAPLAPVSEITGFTGIDRTIWELAILSGQQQFPLLNDFFQVPTQTLLNGYNFGNAVDPSAGVGVNGAVPGDAIFGFPGTQPEIDPATGLQAVNSAGNPINLMPWANLDFKLDPSAAFQNFFTSLEAPANLNGFDIPSFQEIATALQTFAAGAVVAFDPFVAGSPVCPATCGLAEPLTQQALVQDIANLFPGNTSVDHWLALTANGMANGPTQEQIAFAEQFLGPQSTFDINNPLPSNPPFDVPFAPYTPISFETSPLILNLIQLMKDSGVQNFAAELASLQGFVPAFGADAATTAASTASTDLIGQLATDLGLGQLVTDLGLPQLLADIGLAGL
jgi:hypothetical protein